MADIETPRWRCKEKIGNMMSRLQKHGAGEIEMTQTQIAAAKLYLSKTLPDLQSIQHSGDADNPVKVDAKVEIVHVKPD